MAEHFRFASFCDQDNGKSQNTVTNGKRFHRTRKNNEVKHFQSTQYYHNLQSLLSEEKVSLMKNYGKREKEKEEDKKRKKRKEGDSGAF